ncbi:MAG: ComEA family DNA-binding protein [Deltaproteobacteria bacterium]|nr:ComEA family DNA-binding protein [Deltaproteobacteria bacterium]
MRDERLSVAGLLVLAASAWVFAPVWRAVVSVTRPAPAVLYAPAPHQPLVWSPPSRISPEADGTVLGAPGRPPAPVSGWQGLLLGTPLDLNDASAADLEALPGIGPKTAAAILETRGRLGRFGTVEELTEARGIGPRTLERLRPLVRVPAPAPGPRSRR